jgi:hypothetical protein
MRNYFKKIILLFCIPVFGGFNILSQNTYDKALFNAMKKESDSIGIYDMNIFIIGEIELDSLVDVCYKQKQRDRRRTGEFVEPPIWVSYTNRYITKKDNIPFVIENKDNLNNLIYNNYFFDVETDYNIVRYFIYLQCNEYQKKRLDETFEKGESSNMIGLDYLDYTRHEIDNEREIYYYNIRGKNKYLLVLMNRTWRRNRIYKISDPPTEPDTSNTYIKYLIPLVP